MRLTCKEQASALKKQSSSASQFEGSQFDKSAAYAFLQAYALHPGWAIVDHELDLLEGVVDQEPRYLSPRHLEENWNPRFFNLHSILANFWYKMEQLT